MFFVLFFCLSVCPILSTYELKRPHTNSQLYQTKININGIDMAESAAQLLYGPVLVKPRSGGTTYTCIVINVHDTVQVALFLCSNA